MAGLFFAITVATGEGIMTVHPKHMEWLAGRGIDQLVIDSFGLASMQREGAAWITVPYLEDGLLVNRKWRRVSVKDHRMDTGAPLLLFNVDDLIGAEEVVITEGEWDLLALKTASLEIRAVSVPNGAPGEESENPWEAKRYEWYQRHLTKLDKIKRFILATDADAPGRMLAADLAVLLGPERCRFVTYPDGCKDLNEVLLTHGSEAVLNVIATAKPYPIKGLYRFSDYPPREEVISIESRLPGVKDKWPLVMGTTTIITGWSGIGKTSLLMWIMADYLKQGVGMAVGSFETDVTILKKAMRAALMETSWADRRVHEKGDEVDELLERQMLLISQHCGAEEHEMTLEYLLDCARIAVVRDGIRLLVIDPWNELEHKRRRDETETDYIGRAIRAIKRFARRYNIAIWVIAHPVKPGMDMEKPPTLYSISGSSHWANKADYGAIVHRIDKRSPVTDLIMDKVRMGLPGQEGLSRLVLDRETSSYRQEL